MNFTKSPGKSRCQRAVAPAKPSAVWSSSGKCRHNATGGRSATSPARAARSRSRAITVILASLATRHGAVVRPRCRQRLQLPHEALFVEELDAIGRLVGRWGGGEDEAHPP